MTSLSQKHICCLVFLIFNILIVESQNIETYESFEDIEFERVEIPVDDGLTLRESAQQIQEDENGVVWTVISTGLYRFNGHTVINVTDYLANKHYIDFGNEFGNCFYLDEDKIIWYGTRNGLYKLDLATYSSKKILFDSIEPNKTFRNQVTRLKKRNDTLFVGTGNGVYLVNSKNNKIVGSFLTEGVDYGWRMSSKNTHSIMVDVEPGHLWAALGDGLYRINLKTNKSEQFQSKTQVWDYSHYYFDGIRYDSILLMPSYGMGMVGFDMQDQTFTDYKTNTEKGNGWQYNCIRSAIKLNDSISLVNASNIGFALFNRYSKTYNFIKTPVAIEEEGAFIDVDRNGFAWSGRYGGLYRSTKPILERKLPSSPVVDVSALFVNGQLRNRPAIDGYDSLVLDENDTNLQLVFNYTQSLLYDSLEYEYKLDEDDWKNIITPNNLSLYNLDAGNHQIEIRAKNNHNILANRKITFEIYRPFYKSSYFIPLCLTFLFGLGFIIWELQNRRKRKVDLLKSNFESKLTELEAKALRSQINPHFIFNTLNSIKYYAIKKSKSETTEFITKFSTLIRQVLENSKQTMIPLEDEVETLKNYLEIEKMRLQNSFQYHIKIEKHTPTDFMIPPMVIQPFIENAIWHGLMHKESDRKLHLEFSGDRHKLKCIITDNGIGRKAAQQITKNRPHKTSLGINITQERLEKLSELYNLKSSIEIVDLYDDKGNSEGTKVIVKFLSI